MASEALAPLDVEEISLVPLGTMTAKLAEPIALVGTCAGARFVYEVIDARLEGERISASMTGSAAADWLIVGPDGTGTLDVRATLVTDDGAVVFVQYNGRCDVRNGPGTAPVYVAPRFETGDERYAWLNRVQAVGKGRFDLTTSLITYRWYEIV